MGFMCSIIFLTNHLAKIIVFDIKTSFIVMIHARDFSKAETPNCFIENKIGDK
jgi:hypothetical protein